MKITTMVGVAVAVSLATPAVSATTTSPPERATAPAFAAARIMNDDIRVPLPEGFCEPTGPYIAQAQLIAAADNDNVTVLQLNSCAEMAAGGRTSHFAVMKAGKKTLTANISLADLLAAMGALPKSAFADLVNGPDVQKKVEDGFGQVSSAKIELKSDLQPVASDDAAYYLAGLMTGTVGENSGQLALAIAITSVRGHVVSYDFYAPGATARDVANVLQQAKTEVHRLLKAN